MKNFKHILVIDDDNRIRGLLGKYLIENGYFVTLAEDAKSAKNKMKEFLFDLIIIDVMMPGQSGIELTTEIKNEIDLPILMLTAMSEIEDRIKGLESGADDYLSKPFEPRELLLRVKNLISRSSNNKTKILKLDSCEYNPLNKRLSRGADVINLTGSEMALFKYLVKNLGLIISRDDVMSELGNVNERTIDVQITRLRNKIEENPKEQKSLKTVRGKGYALYGYWD